jgi:hypothetical protein
LRTVFNHILQPANLTSLVKGDEFIKLCTILERRRATRFWTRRAVEEANSGYEIRPTVNLKAFDVVLTGDHGAVSVRNIGDDEQD